MPKFKKQVLPLPYRLSSQYQVSPYVRILSTDNYTMIDRVFRLKRAGEYDYILVLRAESRTSFILPDRSEESEWKDGSLHATLINQSGLVSYMKVTDGNNLSKSRGHAALSYLHAVWFAFADLASARVSSASTSASSSTSSSSFASSAPRATMIVQDGSLTLSVGDLRLIDKMALRSLAASSASLSSSSSGTYTGGGYGAPSVSSLTSSQYGGSASASGAFASEDVSAALDLYDAYALPKPVHGQRPYEKPQTAVWAASILLMRERDEEVRARVAKEEDITRLTAERESWIATVSSVAAEKDHHEAQLVAQVDLLMKGKRERIRNLTHEVENLHAQLKKAAEDVQYAKHELDQVSAHALGKVIKESHGKKTNKRSRSTQKETEPAATAAASHEDDHAMPSNTSSRGGGGGAARAKKGASTASSMVLPSSSASRQGSVNRRGEIDDSVYDAFGKDSFREEYDDRGTDDEEPVSEATTDCEDGEGERVAGEDEDGYLQEIMEKDTRESARAAAQPASSVAVDAASRATAHPASRGSADAGSGSIDIVELPTF